MLNSLKLLVVGVSWPPETFLQRLLRGLADAGMEVTIASSRKPDAAWLAHRNIHWLQTPDWAAPSFAAFFSWQSCFPRPSCGALEI